MFVISDVINIELFHIYFILFKNNRHHFLSAPTRGQPKVVSLLEYGHDLLFLQRQNASETDQWHQCTIWIAWAIS